MKATILYDEHGRIVAISKIGDLKEAGSKFDKAGVIPGVGQRALEVDLSSELESLPLRELHEQHRIDVITLKLVRKTELHERADAPE